jgi:hypothetical protein
MNDGIRADILSLRRRGARPKEIAADLGLSRGTVNGVLFRAGMSGPISMGGPSTGGQGELERAQKASLQRSQPRAREIDRRAAEATVSALATCQFPLWGNCKPPKPPLFCDQPSRIGSSYCPDHHAVVFVKIRLRDGS